MPRTLPWLTGQASKADRPKESRIRKRAHDRVDQESNADDLDVNIATPKRKADDALFRSSSISPVAREPPSEEYMREGLDGDDIYVMVEDEFQSVAQSFTRHLHYAEYIRRTKQAQIDNATKLNDLARPIDGRTVMRAETRKKKEAESMSDKQKRALEKMKGSASERRPPVDSEDDDTRIEEDEEDDPWLGTSLQGLMTKSKTSQSLVGLQGIHSTTRAAAGFSKSSESNLESLPTGIRKAPHVTDDEVTTSGGDDDLDAGPRQEAVPKIYTPLRRTDPPLPPKYVGPRDSSNGHVQQSNTPNTPVEHPSRSSSGKGFRDRSSTPRATYRPRMSLPFDEFDDPVLSRQDKTVPRRNSAYSKTITPKKEESDDEKKKKTRLNEVPIFLA